MRERGAGVGPVDAMKEVEVLHDRARFVRLDVSDEVALGIGR
jgi:hypothetical protein